MLKLKKSLKCIESVHKTECVKRRSLFAQNKVRFARAQQNLALNSYLVDWIQLHRWKMETVTIQVRQQHIYKHAVFKKKHSNWDENTFFKARFFWKSSKQFQKMPIYLIKLLWGAWDVKEITTSIAFQLTSNWTQVETLFWCINLLLAIIFHSFAI